MMLVWLSLLSAMVHAAAVKDRQESIVFLAVQLVCLTAGMTEAGSLESGRKTRGRRILQAAAVLSTVCHLAWTTFKGP